MTVHKNNRELPESVDQIAVPISKRSLMAALKGLPEDTTFIFRGARKSPKTERVVTDIIEVAVYGGLTYVIFGGYE